MKIYKTRSSPLKGTDFHEIRRKAFGLYREIKRKTKRKPYARSSYFGKEKIFLDLFWSHLFEKKNFVILMRRMKFYPCALELIQKSHLKPTSKVNPNKPSELLHRFAGVTPENHLFFVQIKENRHNGKKWLISAFPID